LVWEKITGDELQRQTLGDRKKHGQEQTVPKGNYKLMTAAKEQTKVLKKIERRKKGGEKLY